MDWIGFIGFLKFESNIQFNPIGRIKLSSKSNPILFWISIFLMDWISSIGWLDLVPASTYCHSTNDETEENGSHISARNLEGKRTTNYKIILK